MLGCAASSACHAPAVALRSVRLASWRPRKRRSAGRRRRRGRRKTRRSEPGAGSPGDVQCTTNNSRAYTACWCACLSAAFGSHQTGCVTGLLTCLTATTPLCLFGAITPLHREKEAAKAAERTEKAVSRTTKSAAVSVPLGPPDDEDLEMEKLMAVSPGKCCGTTAGGRTTYGLSFCTVAQQRSPCACR